MAKTFSRKWRPSEYMLTAQFLREYFPHAPCRTQVRLGRITSAISDVGLTEEERRMLGVHRPYADAAVFEPGVLTLIESSIQPKPGKISQLQLYARLVPVTQDLRDWWNAQLRLVLVVAIDHPYIRQLAHEQGIEYVHFCPAWCVQYVRTLRPRDQVPTRYGQPTGASGP